MKLNHLLVIAFIGILLFGCTGLPNIPSNLNLPGQPNLSDEPPALPSDDQVGAGQAQHVAVDSAITSEPVPLTESSGSIEQALVGNWRVRYSRMFYDSGGGGDEGSSLHSLVLGEDGTWSFSSSHGQWNVQVITDADWAKWNVTSYGPKKKIVLNNWSGKTVDGPIEETSEGPEFIWLIYHVEPPTVIDPGQIQTKFGHG